MKWTAEQDVVDLLLHRMGKLDSLEGVLNLEAGEVPLERLERRAGALNLAHLQDGNLKVDPDLEALLESASQARELVEIIAENDVDSEVIHYYYLCPGKVAAVDRVATSLVLRPLAPKEAVEEATALAGVIEAKREAKPVTIPAPTAEGAQAARQQPSQLRALESLMVRSKLCWALKIVEGQIVDIEVVFRDGGKGWILRQEGEEELALCPLEPDQVRAMFSQMFGTSPGSELR